MPATPTRPLGLLVLSTLLCLSSCVITSVTPLSSSPRPQTDPADVQIYVDARDIPGPHEKVGLIHARGDSYYTDQNAMLQKARKEAAKLGANGLLLRGMEEASQGAKVAASFLGMSTQRHGEMLAIFVHPSTARADERDAGLADEGEVAGDESADDSGAGPSFEEWLVENKRQASEDKLKSDQ